MKPTEKFKLWSGGALLAQGIESSLLERVGGLFPGEDDDIAGSRTAGDLIFAVVELLLLVAGSIAVIFLLVGAFKYIAARGNEEAATSAKKTMSSAIIGIVIIILAFAIIRIVSNLLVGVEGI